MGIITHCTLTPNTKKSKKTTKRKRTTKTNVKIQNGFPYTVLDNELRAGFIINPKINMVIEGKVQFRKYTTKLATATTLKTNSFMVSFATNIFNRYYDLPVVF